MKTKIKFDIFAKARAQYERESLAGVFSEPSQELLQKWKEKADKPLPYIIENGKLVEIR